MPLLVNKLSMVGPFPRIIVSLLLTTFCLFTSVNRATAHDGPHVTIKPGDTLSQIARTHGYDLSALMRLNNLSDPNHVYVGQQVAIPTSAQPNNTSPSNTPSLASTASSTSSLAASSSSSSAQPSAKWQPYVVKQGDSLSVLAHDYRVGLARLAEINRISPSQNLYVGQVLLMPLGSSSISASAAVPAQSTTKIEPASEVVTQDSVHYVRQGEHLGTIAPQYGTTPQAIAQANFLPNASHLIPGQRLVIPTGTSSAANVAADPDRYAHFPTTTEKWIDVNLTDQTVTAYDGITAVASFLVSTGLPETPTVQGTFRIWATTPIQDMYSLSRSGSAPPEELSELAREGYDYYIDDVEWVQYFHQDYAFHAAYWHNSFGQPMSHGCVNMRTDDAQWLFEWASPQASMNSWSYYSGYNRGTLVKVRE